MALPCPGPAGPFCRPTIRSGHWEGRRPSRTGARDFWKWRRDDGTWFDFGEWKTPVASCKNDDGTTAFVTLVPGFGGETFVVGDKDAKRTLTFRDAQHEYVFTAVESAAPTTR